MVEWNPTLEAGRLEMGSIAAVAEFALFLSTGLLSVAMLLPATRLSAQVDTVTGAARAAVWVSHGHIEGHLALNFSSDGAFSPDGSLLAVASDEKFVILDLRNDAAPKVLKPRFPELHDLEIHSANFVSPQDIFILANGVVRPKGKVPGATPLLAFQWNIEGNHLDGKLTMLGAKGGFSPARYFPAIGYVSLYKDSNFELWKPVSNQGGVVPIAGLTQIPNLYEFSPDGHWLLLAQIQTTSERRPQRGGTEDSQICR